MTPAETATSGSVRSLSCWLDEVDAHVFDQIVVEYISSMLTLALDECEASVAADGGPSIRRLLDHPAASRSEPFWCPAAGGCLAALKARDMPAAVAGIAQIALNLSAAGAAGDWEATIPLDRRLHYGTILLPAGRHLRVETIDRETHVTVDTGAGRATLHVHRNGLVTPPAEGHRVLPCIREGAFPLLLLGEADIDPLNLPRPGQPFVADVTAEHQRRVGETLQFLAANVPHGSAWVRRAARCVALVESPSTRVHSGSFERYFGYLYLTGVADPIRMAEMFIHECSHQYFHLVTCLGDVADDHERSFYSPFARADRHADRILLAYHAFANVELFYRACRESGIEATRAIREMDRLRPDLDTIEDILLNEAHLTPIGKDLLLPLVSARGVTWA